MPSAPGARRDLDPLLDRAGHPDVDAAAGRGARQGEKRSSEQRRPAAGRETAASACVPVGAGHARDRRAAHRRFRGGPQPPLSGPRCGGLLMCLRGVLRHPRNAQRWRRRCRSVTMEEHRRGVSRLRWHRQHGIRPIRKVPGVTGRPRASLYLLSASTGETSGRSTPPERPPPEGHRMNVPLWLWLATIGGLVAIILADLFLVDHKPHAVTAREATRWVLFYVALAVAFGIGLWLFAGACAGRGVLRRATSPSTRCRWTTCSSSSSSWRRSGSRPSTSTGCCSSASSSPW